MRMATAAVLGLLAMPARSAELVLPPEWLTSSTSLACVIEEPGKSPIIIQVDVTRYDLAIGPVTCKGSSGPTAILVHPKEPQQKP